MADVPLTIAVISTISPVVAGAIPVFVGWFRDSARDKRDREERVVSERTRLEQEKRAECIRLLGMARDFRVLAENTGDATGSDLDTYAKMLRQSAADLTGQADQVGFMVFEAEAAASSLAAEARLLAGTLADGKNRALGAALLSPDFTKLDQCLADFKADARAAFGYQLGLSQPPSRVGQLQG